MTVRHPTILRWFGFYATGESPRVEQPLSLWFWCWYRTRLRHWRGEP